MPQNTQDTLTMTQADALIWLAGLEKDCPCQDPEVKARNAQRTYVCGLCHNTGKVPILDLREPCPCPPYCVAYISSSDDQDWRRCDACSGSHGTSGVMGVHGPWCENCQGRNWFPKQGRDPLFGAMEKDGWGYTIRQTRMWREVFFSKEGPNDSYGHPCMLHGKDANDWQAAVKALRAAGY